MKLDKLLNEVRSDILRYRFKRYFKEKENKNKENDVIKFKGENRVIAGGINCPPTTLRTKRN